MSESPYYVPESSRYPIVTALGAGLLLLGAGLLIANRPGGSFFMILGALTFISVLFVWFNTVVGENLAGLNNAQLKQSYVMGMAWFIFSEVMFFATFFGCLFYVRVFAVSWLGGEGDKGLSGDLWPDFQAVWPLMSNPDNAKFPAPETHMSWPGFSALTGWLPFWNTVVLLTSSVTLTFAHHGLKGQKRWVLNIWLGITLLLAIAFLFLQVEEYLHAYNELGLTLQSGIYGSTFFLLTGFHGAHVTLGGIMLSVMLLRSLRGHFKPDDHFGFEAAAWYWHFVDVVWVMLFIFVYLL